MRHWWIGLAAAALMASPAAAATEIPAKPGKDWKHKPTGLAFPDTLAGLKRRQVVYFSAPEVDVGADYWSADGNDTVTIYIYRNVTGNVPLWFDRSRHFITNLRDKYGVAQPTGVRPFTPRGQSAATGLMESYSIEKAGRSSALAVLPFSGFYAKVRATSKTRDNAGLEALLMEALNAFDWSSKPPHPAAVPVADCAAPLAKREPAKPLEASGEDRMMAGILGGLFSQVATQDLGKGAEARPPVTYCREPEQSSLDFSMYRADNATDHYLLAVLDGGRAITVGRNSLAELINGEVAESEGQAAGPPRYTVSMVQLDRIETYGDFTSLPLPQQAAEHVDKTRPVSVAGTWGKQDKQVTITTD